MSDSSDRSDRSDFDGGGDFLSFINMTILAISND